MYTTRVFKSNHCCAVYELSGLPSAAAIDSSFIKWALEESKKQAQPENTLPLLIQFTDAKGNQGDKLREQLLADGYKCDKIELGNNPKSGRYVVLYHWFTNKTTYRKSINRQYGYKEAEIQTRTGIVGRAAREGTSGTGTKSGRLLRSIGRGRTGL